MSGLWGGRGGTTAHFWFSLFTFHFWCKIFQLGAFFLNFFPFIAPKVFWVGHENNTKFPCNFPPQRPQGLLIVLKEMKWNEGGNSFICSANAIWWSAVWSRKPPPRTPSPLPFSHIIRLPPPLPCIHSRQMPCTWLPCTAIQPVRADCGSLPCSAVDSGAPRCLAMRPSRDSPQMSDHGGGRVCRGDVCWMESVAGGCLLEATPPLEGFRGHRHR